MMENIHKLTWVSAAWATWLTLALTVFIWTLYRKQQDSLNLPPGPWGLPFVGYLPWIPKRNPYLHFTDLQKKYGPLISFYIGNHLVVILGNHDVIKEAYVTQGDVFAGKPAHSPMIIDGDERGITVADGPDWHEQRRFVTKTLMDYGVGKESLEHYIKEEVLCFLKLMKTFDGEAVDLRQYLGPSISNNICCLEFGKRFEYNDSNFVNTLALLEKMTSLLELIPTAMFFSWTKRIPGTERFMNYGKLQKLKKQIYRFITKIVKEHEQQFATSEHRDLIYSWFDEMSERIDKNSEEPHIFDKDNLLFNLLSLFIAGSQSVLSSLLTAVYLFAKHPSVQERCRQEINDNVGVERLVSMEDRPSLPYVEATLLEVQRMVSVNPLGLVHRCMEDTKIFGHDIPKDAVVFGNQYAVHHDLRTWQEPQKFRPERFLNDKCEVINEDDIIPFSVGKRSCMGIQLAKMELYLYFTAFIQNFEFLPPGRPGDDFQIEYGGSILRMARPFKIRARPLQTAMLGTDQ